jgi:L-ascorbate metabolism protein UlaG (beta-lactamase superfamily)
MNRDTLWKTIPCSFMTLVLSPTAQAEKTTFDNVYPFPQKSIWTGLKFSLTRKPAKWPESLPLKTTPMLEQNPVGEQATVTWIGHATFLIEFENMRVLTDPVYSDSVSPISWLGPKRVTPPALSLEKTPKVDLILLSHDHFDHMDLPTLAYLARRDNPVVIAGTGNRPLLEETGFKNIVELGWWDNVRVREGADVTFVPAQHWSARSIFNRNTTLWGGFYLRAKGKTLYFAGDTGYHPKLFKEIRDKVGSPDLSLIPIGAYRPRDFMKDQHVDPGEAVDIHIDVKSAQSIGMHWGTFQLSDEPINEPCESLSTEAVRRNLEVADFTCMTIGETRTLFSSEPKTGI